MEQIENSGTWVVLAPSLQVNCSDHRTSATQAQAHMKHQRRVFPLCAAVAAIASGANVAAPAAMISDSAFFTADETLSLDLFDSGLGTLTDVMLTIESTWDTFLEVDYDGPEGRASDFSFPDPYFVEATSSHNLEVSGLPGGGSGSIALTGLSAECSYPATGSRITRVMCDTFFPGSDSGSLNGDIATLFSVAPPYSAANFLGGAGDMFDFDLAGLASLDTCENPASFTDPAECSLGTDWRGTVTVTYTFDEVQVPAPAALSLLGIGLMGLAWSRQRA